MYQLSGFSKHLVIPKIFLIIILFGSVQVQSADHINQVSKNRTTRIVQKQNIRLQRIKQFQAYFDSKVTVVPASVPVRSASDYSPIQWPDFGNALIMTDMTVVFLTSGRYNYLSRVLASFFKYNTYPVTKMFIGHDGQDNPRLRQLIDTYKNITWIITNIKVGQLEALDQTFKYIDTQYFYFAEDDFDYFNYGFVQYGLQALMYDPKLMALQMRKSGYDLSAYLSVGPLKVVTHIHSYHFAGFCFSASTRRLKDYKLLEHGYNYATFNGSFGIGSGASQSHISLLYTQMGFHYARTVTQFCQHIGQKTQGHKFDPDESTMDDDIKNLTVTYDNWFKKNNDLEQVKKSLSYLIPIEGVNNMTICRLNSTTQQIDNQNRQLKKKLMQLQIQSKILISVLVIVTLLSVFMCASICSAKKNFKKDIHYHENQDEDSMISSNEIKMKEKSSR